MEWLDAHQGSALVFANVVLVLITAYYAWSTRALVRESHASLQATARNTLQGRLDRISELMLGNPGLFQGLDDPNATGEEQDGRFHLANMLFAVLEEAHTQYAVDHVMSEEDWRAWVVTADLIMHRRFLVRYWQRVAESYGAPFRRFVDERLSQPQPGS